MLIRLFGRNFRSLREDFEISMVAADLTRAEDCERGIIEVQLAGLDEPLRLLRVVALYGPNASGKSTVLTAAHAIHWLVKHSSHLAKPNALIPPYEPFKLDEATRAAPVHIGCDVVHNKQVLRYEVTYTSHAVQHESLKLLGSAEPKVLFEREPSGKVTGRLIGAKGVNRLYVKDMQPNVTVLSKLAHHGPQKGRESVLSYFTAVCNATKFVDYSSSAHGLVLGRNNDRFADDPHYREWIMQHLIRTADVGICDVQTRRERVELPDFLKEIAKNDASLGIEDDQVIVTFVHSGRLSVPIEFSDESSGTRKLYNIASDWWSLSHEPVTLLADELSASLHPKLLDRLIRAINESLPGRMQSQLIFTTHDTGLLESIDGRPPALRRDQVYFTSKNTAGESELYSLAEFKDDARPVHNIRKRYLSGLYGAIPKVENLEL